MGISEDVRRKLLAFQKSEITEHHIYRRLAATIPSPENRRVLEHIADDERRHYEQWRAYTQQEVPPDRWHIAKYFWISRILGFTFGVKLMEMAGLSLGVAAFSFLVGFLMRTLFGIDI